MHPATPEYVTVLMKASNQAELNRFDRALKPWREPWPSDQRREQRLQAVDFLLEQRQ
jgi:hypothetical protein